MSTVVLDASVLVELVVGTGTSYAWAAAQVAGADLASPSLALYEAADILRRLASHGSLNWTEADLAHADLMDLPLETWDYQVTAQRGWAHRANLTTYDASYVALAELLQAPLLTLDRRIAAAPGLQCQVRCPPPS